MRRTKESNTTQITPQIDSNPSENGITAPITYLRSVAYSFPIRREKEDYLKERKRKEGWEAQWRDEKHVKESEEKGEKEEQIELEKS